MFNIQAELNDLIIHVSNQTEEKWRWRYYGEAKGMIKALLFMGHIGEAESNEFNCKLKHAFDDSIRLQGATDSGEKPSKLWHLCPITYKDCETKVPT